MNSEDKIFNKIKSASQKGEKDFPGMDKVWNRVEEKLDNTIVVKKKNTWQKLAIAASVLLSFSIIYHFVSKDEIINTTKQNFDSNTENPVIVSSDSAEKIIEKAKEVVVDNDIPKIKSNVLTPDFKTSTTTIEENAWASSFAPATSAVQDSAVKIYFDTDKHKLEENKIVVTEINSNLVKENAVGYSNSVYNSSNSSNSNGGYVAPTKKYDTPKIQAKSKYKAPKSKAVAQEKNDDLIVINGEVKDKKELDKLNAEEIDEITHLKKPIYIINGIEYSEESLFGKKPTSPYAPLDKQEIISINVIKAEDAMKVYGKKGENGVIIIVTKDGKPVKK